MLLANANNFANANNDGNANTNNASNVGGVRPLLRRHQQGYMPGTTAGNEYASIRKVNKGRDVAI